VNTGASFPELVVARERVLHFQRKLHEWASIEHEPLDVLMESRVRGNSHARFGGRRRGNHRLKSRHWRLAADPASRSAEPGRCL
jgi:hypothetical protein